MTGNDNEGSRCIYGRDVDIVADDSAALSSATASNKVRFSWYSWTGIFISVMNRFLYLLH